MTTILWQSLVTGVLSAAGFALYLRLMTKFDLRAKVIQTVMVGALAAVLSFALRVLF